MSARLRAWFRKAPAVVASPEATAADGNLVRRFADTRDEAAFAELVRRHGPMVLATCRRVLHPDVHTADDAFQAAFLVLATKAAAVSPPERVGAFLHGVAVLVAKKAKAWARKLVPSPPADLDRVPAAPFEVDPDTAEMRATIDEVLAGLPSKYRCAVVLCDLEGRSRAEAAALLGWREGTLSGRLARARKLLADRLARRGVAISAAVVVTGLGVLLPASAAQASVPVQLAVSTVRAAVLVSTGSAVGATSGAIPASVAALAQGVPMHSTAFKLLTAALVLLALALGGFGLFALTAAPPAPTVPPEQPDKSVGAAPARAPAEPRWVPKHTFAHKSPVTALALGPEFLAAGDKDGALILWDPKTGKEKETLLAGGDGGAKPINRIQVSPDGAWLYLVTNDGDGFHQCSVEKKDRRFPGSGDGQVTTHGVTPDGKYWLRAAGKRVLRLVENSFPQNVVPFLNVSTFTHDKDIEFLAACDADFIGTISDGVFRRWGAGKQKALWEAKLEKFEPTALAACPTAKVFALGGKNGEVRVYAGITGKLTATLKGHEGAVTAIGFSADGTRIVTGSADKTARIWNVEKGKEVAALKEHTDAVTAVAFGPDGDAIATGSADKTVKLWKLKK